MTLLLWLLAFVCGELCLAVALGKFLAGAARVAADTGLMLDLDSD